VEEYDLRIFITQVLRKRGWLVHGIRQREQALSLLAHIPYELVIIDCEVREMSGIDYMRRLRNARKWLTIKLVFITNSQNIGFVGDVVERGVFLARKSRWEDDLCEYLSACDEG
jgi:DNA-binding response OmpR family regulator